jgi:hypothetical protein
MTDPTLFWTLIAVLTANILLVAPAVRGVWKA